MRRDPGLEGDRWARQAERDIDDARYALGGKRFNLACFLSQQAAEKAVKAFLYSQGALDVWGHSVADLCEQAEDFDKDFRQLRTRISPLDKYYIPTRYPNGLPGGIPAEAFDEADARGAISQAEEALQFVRARIPRRRP